MKQRHRKTPTARAAGSAAPARFAMRALGASLLVAASAVAQAGPYTAEYVFGDSLSDNGNLAEALYHTNFPNPPSYHDSFSNGPVAAQLLATRLGLSYNPSLWLTGFADPYHLFGTSFVPGTNYAVAAATAAATPVGGVPGINLPYQIAAFGAHTNNAADPNALYVIDIGGNDVRNAALQGTGAAAVITGVQTELAAIRALVADGAKNFFIVNVPNVGVIPEFTQDNPALAGQATTFSQLYDAMLASGIASLGLPVGINLTQFDLYGYNAYVQANAASFGLTNLTDRCYTNTPLSAATSVQCGPNAINIDQFAYWDAIHPTETVQLAWARGFAGALGVPEPSSVALFGVGLVGLFAGAKRKKRG